MFQFWQANTTTEDGLAQTLTLRGAPGDLSRQRRLCVLLQALSAASMRYLGITATTDDLRLSGSALSAYTAIDRLPLGVSHVGP